MSGDCQLYEGIKTCGWVATEHRESVENMFTAGDDESLDAVVQGWMESIGPTTTGELASRLLLPHDRVEAAMLRLEAQGQVIRGRFRSLPSSEDVQFNGQGSGAVPGPEWCHRRLLARIHRLTVGRLRKEVQPVTASEFMRFLLQWQHVAGGARRHGEAGLLETVRQLAGFEAAASSWETHLLRVRMAKYEPELLDRLCLSGAVSWGRLSLHPRLAPKVGATAEQEPVRRIVPTKLATIGVFPRDDAEWLLEVPEEGPARPDALTGLSAVAQDLRRLLGDRGACFFADLVRMSRHLPAEVEEGLWELAAAGVVTADGFDNLRALMDPRRRRAEGRERSRRPRHAPGRWSLLRHAPMPPPDPSPSSDRQKGRNEATARQLLRRYGIVFRDLLMRESLVTAWRDLLVVYRRMELKGEVRGGRFVEGFTGEQFALPEAVEALRAGRTAGSQTASAEIRLSACDPLNLAGVILPGPRVPAVPTNFLILREGTVVRTILGRERVVEWGPDLKEAGHRA